LTQRRFDEGKKIHPGNAGSSTKTSSSTSLNQIQLGIAVQLNFDDSEKRVRTTRIDLRKKGIDGFCSKWETSQKLQ